MAFLTKNSRYLYLYKLGRNSNFSVVTQSTIQYKLASCVFIASPTTVNYFSTVSTQRFQYRTNVSTKTLPLFSLSSRHYLSTESHHGNSQVTATGSLSESSDLKDTFLETSTNKVAFVETPTLVDTAEAITDSAASSSSLVTDLSSVVADFAEPSLSSLGLCHWTPVGLVQAGLEFLHISSGMPWWGAIVAATFVARVLMFPVFVITQRNAASMANYMPQMTYLQQKFNTARKMGNQFEAGKCAQDLMSFMKDNQINPLKNAMIPMIQAPVFISFFLGLRKMAILPVESMKTGGLWWITDLTIPDPYYIMPLVASATLYVILKVGADSGMRLENMKLAKYVVYAIPIVIFPFCTRFPSAVLFYWCTNNFMTLASVLILKIDYVRRYFNIPKMVPPPPEFATKKKGFIETVKETYEDQKILSAIEDRRRIDRVRFEKAGTGPIPRTYSYDPTKPRPAAAAAAAASQQKQIKT